MYSNPISEKLIAPCGMNCAVCSRYLSYVNNMKRSRCIGCRPGNRICTYLFEKCKGVNNGIPTGNAVFCFECGRYPCEQIIRMEKRYKKNYRMSVKDNLDCIKRKGMHKFVDEQYGKHQCLKCGGLISIHNGKCFKCDPVTRLVEKAGGKTEN